MDRIERAADGADAARARFGAHVRRSRLVQQQTQADLASHVGISVQTLRALERGDPGVTLGIVFRVLEQLGAAADVADAPDPTRTEVGRLHADDLSRQRAPRRR